MRLQLLFLPLGSLCSKVFIPGFLCFLYALSWNKIPGGAVFCTALPHDNVNVGVGKLHVFFGDIFVHSSRRPVSRGQGHFSFSWHSEKIVSTVDQPALKPHFDCV